MNFFEAVKSAFSKYARFSGRSSLPEFWYFWLFVVIGQFLFGALDAQIEGVKEWTAGEGTYAAIFIWVTCIPFTAVAVRRFHDSGMSGWWVLILYGTFGFSYALGSSTQDDVVVLGYLVDIMGLTLLFYWMCKKGDEGENRFGPYPLASDKKQ